MTVALGTVIHNHNIRFFKDFITSIRNQTEQNFTLVIVLDSLQEDSLEHLDIDYILIKLKNSTPALNRQHLINYIRKNDFDYCIFADGDDILDCDYIKSIGYALTKYKIVFSDLNLLLDSNKHVIYDYYRNLVPSNVSIKFLKNKNCLGFSNSGFKTDLIDEDIRIPHDMLAVDWYLYSILMINYDVDARFIPKSLINYRIHGENLAGYNNLNVELIRKTIEIKLNFYNAMSKIDHRYLNFHAKYLELTELITDEDYFLNLSNKVFNEYRNKKFLWWQII